MNEELLSMVQGMIDQGASQEEINIAVAGFKNKSEVTETPEDQITQNPEDSMVTTDLTSFVQGLIDDGADQNRINEEVAAYKNNLAKMGKPKTTIEEPAPVVVEDMDSQSVDGSLESPEENKLWYEASPEEASEKLENLYKNKPKYKKNYDVISGTMKETPRELSREEMVYEHLASGNAAKFKEIEESVNDEFVFQELEEEYSDLEKETQPNTVFLDGFATTTRKSDFWDEETRDKYEAWEKTGKTFNEEFKNLLKSTGEFSTVKDKYLNNRLTDFTGSLSDEEQNNFNEYLNSTEDYKDFRGERVVEEIANLTKEKEAFENRTKDLNIAELPTYQAKEILNEYNNLKSRILKVEEDSSYIKDWETQSEYVRRKYSVPGKTFLNFASLGGGLFISGLEIAQAFNETARMESSEEEANEDRIIAANVAKGVGIAPTMEETMQAIDATEAPDAAEQAAAEVKPDTNSELMKWAINTQNNIQKDLAENYSKEIELDAIENVGQVLALTGDVVAQQLPNLLMMAAAKGKGQAVASLFGAGYSSRKAEFIQEESAARDTIDQKVEEYRNTAAEDGFSRDIILNELEEAKNVINKDSSLKNLTSIAFGAAETLDVFSKFAFVEDVRKTFKYLPVTAKPTKDMAKSAVLSYIKTQATDQAVEQSINVLQNFADINFDGQDKSYIENYDHVAATSFIMGNGMAATNAVASARSIVLNTIRSKEAAAAVLSNFKQQAELESELKETTDIGTRRILKRKIKQLAKDNVTMQDVTAANFLNLSEEEQKAVFELDREARYIRSTYLNKMQDPNLSETAKDILTEEAVNAYDSKQNDKRVVLDIANKKVPKSQKEVTGESLATAGELLRNYNLTNVSKHQIRAYNNRHKVVDSIYGVSGDDISTINDFLADKSKGDTITIDNIELTRQEAQNVIDMQTDSDGSRVAGKFLKDENGKTSLWVYTDVTVAAGMPNTFVHEYIHAYFQSKGIPRGDFAQIKDTLETSIDNSTTLTEEQKTKAKNRIAQYNSDADYTDGMVGEEIFTLISDVTSNDVLRSEQDRGFWLTLGEQIKSLFKSDIGFENVTDFKTADDVKAFVNDFQKSIIRNKPFTKADRFSSGVIEDEELKNVSSKVVEGVTFEEGSINQEFQKYTYDGKKNNAPDSFHAQAAYAYEPLAQAVVERISKVGFGISKEQDQFVMDYFSNKENKEAFVSDLVFGPDNNKASSLVGIAKRYNPAIGSFGGHAKTYLALQAIRVFEERASKQATQGAQTIDAPESREIAADEQEIDISKPVLERLNIADNISEDIEKLGEMSIIQAEKAISNKDISDLKKLNLRNKTFGDIFAKRLFGDIKNVLGKNTKTKSDFSDFLNNNYEALSDVALNYVDFQKGSGPASLWSLDNPPSKKEFTEYYEAEGEKTSTKSDRKKSLNNAIARAIANDTRIKLTENNPSLNEGFVKATGITLASKVPYDLSLDESLKMISMLDKQDVNIDGVKISSLKTEDEVKAYFDYQEKSVWPLLPKKFLTWSEAPTQNQYLSKSGKELLAGESNSFSKKQRIKLREFAKTEFARRINKFKNFGPEILIDGKPVTDYKNKAYNTIQAPLERIAKGNGTLKDNETITSFNKRNKAIGKEIYTRFNKAVKDDKENAIGIAGFLQLAGNNTEHFNRALAEVVAISINPKGGVKRKYEWEHAMQQAHVSRLLLEGMLDDNRDFEVEFDAIMSNYKLIGLDYALNDLLKEGGFEKSMTGKLGGKWDVLKGTWLSRYFNDIIAELGGIDPAGLMHVSGVTLDKYYGIDTNGNSTKAMSSKVISEPNTPGDFNEASTAYKAIFMVGSPGGGKTNVGRGLKLGRKGYKVVNQDIALEALKTAAGLPENESNYTKEQRSLRSKLGSQAVKAGKDKFQQYKNEGKGFLVDGTGASYNATTKKINELKEAGYDVFLVAAMTPKKVAIERNKARKERSLPTFVVSKSYDQVVESLAKYKQDYGEKVFELDTTTIGFGEALPQEFLDKVYNGITQTKVTKGTLDKVAESKAMSSKVLSDDFNKMLEKVKGVKAEARYSEDRATKLAANKGKFKFFVPYSAEDFVGLIYPTLGKGKEGDKNMQWYKENLLDPFARGISNFESSKQSSMEEWKELKKSIKGTPVDLGKQATRGFSNEEAVRVYLWNERGVVPESLSKKDTDALVKHVEANPDLLTFAENVVGITEGVEYPAPQGDWLAGTLTTDLVNFVNTAKRADFLQEWQDNVDAVYSKDNLNKLKAIYGKDYVDALENILYRMKTGRNRPSGTSKIEAQFMNWVNDSVATVMFLNTRSALLQTISSINFMNWSDNNPLKAAKAFANQPQFWKDFASLMNSDFLKQRRSGLKNDVNADELAREAGQATNKAKAAFAALLKAGFAPTQIADSFAISIGGASFYRNRVNTYVKQGLDQKQAEEKAMLDFKETAEESQQSSRPDKVSMEQASGLGRVILAFANTPAQYTRLTKKAALDLINGRGDWKTNASKILYYGAVQNIIFTTLQQALFALSFDDEKDEEEAMTKVANGIVDTLLRGSGVYGAGVATMKNMILEAIRQYKSKRTDYTKAALKLTTLSPPVDTKIRKLMSAGRAFTYKQSKKDMRELGIDVDNPAALAVGQIASALGNVPLDRAVLKLQNLKAASNQERETWEQIFLAMGYSDWQLGIKDDKSKQATSNILNIKPVRKKVIRESIKREAVERSPINKLERGVAGKAHNDGTIEVDPNLTPVEREKTIAHEKKHVEDMKAGKLNYDDNYVYWNGKKYERKNGKIKYNGKWYEEGHKSLPWEKRAYDAEPTTKEIKKRKKLY